MRNSVGGRRARALRLLNGRGVAVRMRRNRQRGTGLELKVPIVLTVEQTDEVVHADARLDLASGEIDRVVYRVWDVAARGLPWDSADYEFTSGTLSHEGKDVEFSVGVNMTTGQFSVSPSELLEIKLKAAQLFAGLSGADLLANATSRKH
jgi:hypothetical protein